MQDPDGTLARPPEHPSAEEEGQRMDSSTQQESPIDPALLQPTAETQVFMT